MIAVGDVSRQFREWDKLTRSPCLRKDAMQVAFEEGAGVLEVFFGVGFGGGDAVKGFVEDADDALLFVKRRIFDNKITERRVTKILHRRSRRSSLKLFAIVSRTNEVRQKSRV